jgi:hypothetical protein
MDLVYFKLLDGDEIIAEARKVIGGWFIQNPALLVNLQDYKVGLSTWLPYTKLSMGGNIPDASLLLVAEVDEAMAKYYKTWISQGAPEGRGPTPEEIQAQEKATEDK